MPDYPYVYGAAAPRPVHPGGTRVRLFRRKGEQERAEDEGAQGGEPGPEDRAWQALLEGAVAELNAAFTRAGAPFTCELDEDEQGFILHVRRHGREGQAQDLDEEILEPRDLPLWLHRIRVGLGLIVDETA